jgi:hypothetical protein
MKLGCEFTPVGFKDVIADVVLCQIVFYDHGIRFSVGQTLYILPSAAI